MGIRIVSPFFYGLVNDVIRASQSRSRTMGFKHAFLSTRKVIIIIIIINGHKPWFHIIVVFVFEYVKY